MKPMFALTGITLALCSLAVAQEASGEKVVVPARNSTRPRKLDVSIMHGSVTVKAYSGKEVIIETRNSERGRSSPQTVDGMRRIDLPIRGLIVEEEDNVITVRQRMPSSGELTISVPADTSLKLQTMSGDLYAEGVNGEIDLNSHNGRVKLTNVSGSVLAHSLNGPITVTMDKVDPVKPLSFSTLNGTIDVTLPADFKANVKLNTNHGEIWSDFDFKLGGGGGITQQNNTPDGKFRVTVDRNITGTINGGGTEATFHTFNGKIYIRKKK
jgi:DUF4097 and DUF4098 domain-containing protein YvlB